MTKAHTIYGKLALILFLLLAVGGGLAIGFLTAPAGWRIFEHHRGGWPMKIWWAQLVLNFAWSPAFFAAHRIGVALAVILTLLATILAFIATAWRQDRVAAWLFIPYAAWVAFASALNAAILALN